MIDLRVLRDQPDLVRASQRSRGEDVAVVDALVDADERRREAGARYDRLRAEQKDLGRDVSRASGPKKETLLLRAKELAAAVKAAEEERDVAGAEAERLLLDISNLVDPRAPVGGE